MGMESEMPGNFSAEGPVAFGEGEDSLAAAFQKLAERAGARNTLDNLDAVEAALAAQQEELKRMGPDAGGEVED